MKKNLTADQNIENKWLGISDFLILKKWDIHTTQNAMDYEPLWIMEPKTWDIKRL